MYTLLPQHIVTAPNMVLKHHMTYFGRGRIDFSGEHAVPDRQSGPLSLQ